MAQDTNVENLIINKLTKAQYESITNPDPTQLYFITDEVISSADVISALGYTPYNATNPDGFISSATIASLTDVDLTGLADGQVLKYNSTAQKWENSTAGGGTWGSITGTLSNQTDLQNALNSKLSNSGNGGNHSLGIMGTITSSRTEGTWIGYSSEAANWSTACGFQAKATGQTSIATGWNAKATSTNSIQIGYGTNSTPNTLSIGFNNTSYTLLNGITGLIPDARISSDIARTSQIPTNNNQLTNGAGYITGITSSDVTTALGYTPYNATNPNGYITASALTGYATETYVDTGLATKQATLVSGTNIKTINNNSILGSGNLTLDGLPSQTGQSGKFLTTDGTDASWAVVTIPTPTYNSANERITW